MFEPVSKSSIAPKRCSEDMSFSLYHDLLGKPNAVTKLENLDYIACIYDQ